MEHLPVDKAESWKSANLATVLKTGGVLQHGIATAPDWTERNQHVSHTRKKLVVTGHSRIDRDCARRNHRSKVGHYDRSTGLGVLRLCHDRRIGRYRGGGAG